MKLMGIYIFLQLITHFYLTNAARILAVIAVPSFSHQSFFRPLWREYLQNGHQLTLITTDPMPREYRHHHPNLTQIDVSMVYDTVEINVYQMVQYHNDKFKEVNYLLEQLLVISRRELQHPEVQNLFIDKTIQFDLLLIEDIAPVMYVFKHRFRVPCIAVSSLDVSPWTHEFVGNPVHPLLYPNIVMPAEDLEEGLLKRVATVFFDAILRIYYEHVLIPQMDKMVREILDTNIPSILELHQSIDMVFANANPVFSGVRPYTTRTISLAGGFHTSGTKQQPKMATDLAMFLDTSYQGIIYFSLGTNIKGKYLSQEIIKTFMTVFSQIPYRVLWKFELDIAISIPKNVKIVKWCPQQRILKHPNIKAFITQGGIQSLEEALLSAVPVIVIPFFLDQQTNARQVFRNEIGLQLNYDSVTAVNLNRSIVEVVTNSKYKEQARKLSKMILDRPQTPLQEAVWYTEYLLRHGSDRCLESKKLQRYQYYMLDILAIVFFMLILLLFLFCLFLKCFLSKLISMKTNFVKSKSE